MNLDSVVRPHEYPRPKSDSDASRFIKRIPGLVFIKDGTAGEILEESVGRGIPVAQPTTVSYGVTSAKSARLREGVDYPTDLSEFDRFFPDEAKCLRYIERPRWSDGFVCPKCAHAGEAWRMECGLLLCSACRAQTSATAETVFEGTRKQRKLRFIAAWEIMGHEYGANALVVQRMLGVGPAPTLRSLPLWGQLHPPRARQTCA